MEAFDNAPMRGVLMPDDTGRICRQLNAAQVPGSGAVPPADIAGAVTRRFATGPWTPP